MRESGFTVNEDPITKAPKLARLSHDENLSLIGMCHSVVFIPSLTINSDEVKDTGCSMYPLPPAHLLEDNKDNIFENMQTMSYLNDIYHDREHAEIRVKLPMEKLSYVPQVGKFYGESTFLGLVSMQIPRKKIKIDLVINIGTDLGPQNAATLSLNQIPFKEIDKLLSNF